MGKVLSLMGRPLRNYNVESRAHNLIGKEKPTPAPKHKSDQIDYERIMQEYPDVYQENLKKHDQLDKYLKDVYVTSRDPASNLNISIERPLPLDRGQVQDFEYGIQEPQKVPEGRVTLKKALQFITDHQTNPTVNSVEKIAEGYSLPQDITKNILKYYKVFEVYIPEQRKSKAKFAGPSVPRIKVTKQSRKLLEATDEKDST